MCTREYATAAAARYSGSDSGGRAEPTAEANANAEALCPDGNEREVGMRTQRTGGTRARPGRAGASPA